MQALTVAGRDLVAEAVLEVAPTELSSMSVVLIGGQSPEEVEMNMPSDTTPEQPDRRSRQTQTTRRMRQRRPRDPARAGARRRSPRCWLPQSREDTDVGWGDYRERDDDERLLRDRPPHWDNA